MLPTGDSDELVAVGSIVPRLTESKSDMATADVVQTVGVLAFTGLAAVLDYRTRKLPNWMTVSAAALGLVCQVAFNGLAGLGQSLGGFAVGFGILLVLWLIGGGGAGDVKFMGALGAWMGPKWILVTFLLSAVVAVFGGFFMLAALTVQNGYARVRNKYFGKRLFQTSAGPLVEGAEAAASAAAAPRRRLLPYAVPVAVSAWLVLVWQMLLRNAQ